MAKLIKNYDQGSSILIKVLTFAMWHLKTNKGYLFLSIALGKIVIDDTVVMAISAQSPLGIKLMGLRVNDSVQMNGMGYVIESIS